MTSPTSPSRENTDEGQIQSHYQQKSMTIELKPGHHFHLGAATHTHTQRHRKHFSKSKSSGCLLGFLSLLQDFLPPFLFLQPLTVLLLAVKGLGPAPKQLPESQQLIPHRVRLKAAGLFVTKVFLLVLRVFGEMMSSCGKKNALKPCFFNDACDC